MGVSMTTGEAAGAAAALSARLGVRPRDLDVKLLQKSLLNQGALIFFDDEKAREKEIERKELEQEILRRQKVLAYISRGRAAGIPEKHARLSKEEFAKLLHDASYQHKSEFVDKVWNEPDFTVLLASYGPFRIILSTLIISVHLSVL
jgi:hypothetical protein